MANLIITIDGPAGVGKSSTAKKLAQKLDAAFLDTGAMYRAATLTAMQSGCKLDDIAALEKIIDATNFKFQITGNQMTVKINDTDVTEQIRDTNITDNVHFIASAPSLRQRLVKMQRQLASEQRKIVTEGRDQGTVVFPNADYKFFLTADAAKRTKRRADELAQKGIKVDAGKLQQDIEKRDDSDRNRSTAPLVPAKDAVIIDNTTLTLEQTVNKIMELIKH
ncbi:MAG: (d)CMP kinase [Phycisphaerae bacterium]|nr:(d)CMP kinase [Phycisphaerae bacterium]